MIISSVTSFPALAEISLLAGTSSSRCFSSYLDPVGSGSVPYVGGIAPFLVIPLELIYGQIREIPFGRRLINCSAWSLFLAISASRELEPLG